MKLGIFTSCRVVKANKWTKKGDAGAYLLFCYLNLLLFCSSRCRRCLSSLISQTPPISFPELFLLFSKGKSLGTRLNFHGWEMPLNGWNKKITARNTKERYEWRGQYKFKRRNGCTNWDSNCGFWNHLCCLTLFQKLFFVVFNFRYDAWETRFFDTKLWANFFPNI